MTKNISRINDFFIRYLFAQKGNEAILLDFINTVMIDSDLETFKSVTVLNPFNLKQNYYDSETVVDVKAITENNSVVIIEIQAVGNATFADRVLYYWAKNYTTLQDSKINYHNLKPVISINILNFIIDKGHDLPHTSYMIYERETKKLLTDKLQIHFLELPKSMIKLKSKGLSAWYKFFTTKNLKEEAQNMIKEKPIIEEAIKNYEVFTLDKDLMSEYDKRETYLLGQHLMIEEERRIGREEGRDKRNIEIVKSMLEKHYTLEQIMEVSKLSEKEIESIKKEMGK